MKKHISSCPVIGDRRFKRWTKTLTGVDTTKDTGYCFLGDFLDTDRLVELEPGTIVLCYGEHGSVKNHNPEVSLKRLMPNGTWQELYSKTALDKAWALEVRDDIAYTLDAHTSLIETLPTYEQLEKLLRAVIDYRVAGANFRHMWSDIVELSPGKRREISFGVMQKRAELDEVIAAIIPSYCRFCAEGHEARLTPEGDYEHFEGVKCKASEDFRNRCMESVDVVIDDMFDAPLPETTSD